MSGSAAVPAYLGSDFRDAAPGHRFYLYLSVWDAAKGWTKLGDKAAEAAELTRLGSDDHARMSALAGRQAALARQGSDLTVSLPAKSDSPFVTGMGIAHPLENGFAFLTPYGLPYLPGSSVKGVLRQAARDLGAKGDFEDPDRDWSEADIDALFGRPGDRDGGEALGEQRGALTFWDVLPVLAKNASLQWEIMTPHQGEYYHDASGKAAPHDNGSPNPIVFLTVPAGTSFRFNVQCNRTLLAQTAPDLLENDRWQAVLSALFEQAFAWLGFGAKTAVGYGAMALDKATRAEDEEKARERLKAAEEQARLASMDPAERLATELLRSKQDPDQPDYKFLLNEIQTGERSREENSQLAEQALLRLENRRQEVNTLGNKKKKKQRMEEIAADEQRLKSYKES